LRVWGEGDDKSTTAKVVMRRSDSDDNFSTIMHLPVGNYKYCFEVNGEEALANNQPTTTDAQGIANYIQVLPPEEAPSQNSPPGEDNVDIPQSLLQLEGPKPPKPPSVLPAHLNRALLNSEPVVNNGDVLPLPHHVMLNHMYTRPAKGPDTAIFGVTTRYKGKFVTTVFYKKA